MRHGAACGWGKLPSIVLGMRSVVFGIFAAGAVLAVGLAIGCGGDNTATASAKLPEGVRSQSIEHEQCSEGGHKVEQVDVNNDGRPDIKRVYDGGHEICRISDLNRDGKPDMFEYYDAAGNLRRREADYDDNGVVNSIEIYENGKLVRAELDATSQGRIDTWDTFDSAGKRIKRERDSNGDGRVDQWWTYDGDKITVASDKNGDGKPDPDAVVTMGGSGAAPASPGASDAGAPAPSSAPVASSGEPQPPAPTSNTPDAGPPKRGAAKR